MSNEASFWDRIANKYSKSPIKDVPAYEKTMERTRAYLTDGNEALEVGCGTGSTALLLADQVKHMTASDISGNMIEIAKGKAEDQGRDDVDFVRATLDDNPFGGRTFDAVLAFNFLHLLRDVPGAIARAKDLLKPGGVFISKTVCLAERSPVLRVLVYIMQLFGKAPYVNFLSVRDVDALVAAGGFEIVETGEYPRSSRFIVARKT